MKPGFSYRSFLASNSFRGNESCFNTGVFYLGFEGTWANPYITRNVNTDTWNKTNPVSFIFFGIRKLTKICYQDNRGKDLIVSIPDRISRSSVDDMLILVNETGQNPCMGLGCNGLSAWLML